MALDLEDEDEGCPSENLLYKSTNTTIQEEAPLFEEPVDNRYDFRQPEDRLNGAYIIFFLLGTGALLPLNFIMTAKHYWIYKLQNCSEQLPMAKQGASDIRNYVRWVVCRRRKNPILGSSMILRNCVAALPPPAAHTLTVLSTPLWEFGKHCFRQLKACW